jgi:hypothetical protein
MFAAFAIGAPGKNQLATLALGKAQMNPRTPGGWRRPRVLLAGGARPGGWRPRSRHSHTATPRLTTLPRHPLGLALRRLRGFVDGLECRDDERLHSDVSI